MDFRVYLLFWILIVFIGYISYLVSKFGILSSISESYYVLKNKYLFPTFLMFIGGPLVVMAETGFLFFSGGSLFLVALAPLFKEEYDGRIHYMGAMMCIVLGFLSLIFDFQLYWLAGIGATIVAGIQLLRIKNFIWWSEIATFVTIFSGLFYALVIK